MTFPAVIAVSETLVTANAASVVAAIPDGSNVSGRLVVLAVACDGVTAMTWPGSPAWTVLDAGNDGSAASRLEVRYRFVDGSEGWSGTGQTITVSGGTEQWCAHGVLISGQHASQAPEVAAATGASGNFDPPSLTASWGAEDNLWLVFAGADGGPAVTGWPASYADNQQEGDTGGAAAGVTGAMATRNLNGATDNPGAFANDTDPWRALTVVVRPAAVAAATGLPPVRGPVYLTTIRM